MSSSVQICSSKNSLFFQKGKQHEIVSRGDTINCQHQRGMWTFVVFQLCNICLFSSCSNLMNEKQRVLLTLTLVALLAESPIICGIKKEMRLFMKEFVQSRRGWMKSAHKWKWTARSFVNGACPISDRFITRLCGKPLWAPTGLNSLHYNSHQPPTQQSQAIHHRALAWARNLHRTKPVVIIDEFMHRLTIKSPGKRHKTSADGRIWPQIYDLWPHALCGVWWLRDDAWSRRHPGWSHRRPKRNLNRNVYELINNKSNELTQFLVTTVSLTFLAKV